VSGKNLADEVAAPDSPEAASYPHAAGSLVTPRGRTIPAHFGWRGIGFAALLLVAVAALSEVMAFATGRVLAGRGILYRADALDDYEQYLRDRDPLLGWPARQHASEQRDASGARPSPAFPDPGARECVALYGDSFTWGSEVDDEAAWGNQLARRLGCRVANRGVPGYGSDQALMRARREEGARATARAPVVVLAHLSENVLRNVNQYRALLYPGALRGLKPRLRLTTSGRLETIALPAIAPHRYRDFVRRPERYLRNDYFVPGGPSGLRHFAFPYTINVLASFLHFHVRSELAGRPWYAEFYRADHPSGALALTAAILEAFVDEARARGQRPIAMTLPTLLDLQDWREQGRWVHAPLLEALRADGIAVFDAAQALATALGGDDPQTLFGAAHLNERGNALLASLVEERIRAPGALTRKAAERPGS